MKFLSNVNPQSTVGKEYLDHLLKQGIKFLILTPRTNDFFNEKQLTKMGLRGIYEAED